jgi:hypothetical protein
LLHHWGKQRAYWGKCHSSYIVKKCPAWLKPKNSMLRPLTANFRWDLGLTNRLMKSVQFIFLTLTSIGFFLEFENCLHTSDCFGTKRETSVLWR